MSQYKNTYPANFDRYKKHKFIFNCKVKSISDDLLIIRCGNGRTILVSLDKKLDFTLPIDKKINIVVSGQPGSYTLAE